MKKIIAFLMAAAVAVSFAGCGLFAANTASTAASTGPVSAADQSWDKVQKAG